MPDLPASLTFDRVADDYDRTRGGISRGRAYAKVVEPLLSSRGVTLEVGIGTGAVAVPLHDAGRELLGVDLSAPMLRRAYERIGARVVQGDALRLPVASGSVDDAYSVWVLHLVADVRGVLAEVGRVLRAGGRYVVITSLRHRPDDDVGQVTWDMQRELRGPAQDDAKRLVALGVEVGLVHVQSTLMEQDFAAESPAMAAEQIERRLFSATWDLPDERWQSVVEPALVALRALPDTDVRRQRHSRNDVVVFGKP